MERTLEEQSHHNAMAEKSQGSVLLLRETDRRFRVNVFTQPLAKFHAGDLFDKEAKASDLA